jgi:hypothetical protein
LYTIIIIDHHLNIPLYITIPTHICVKIPFRIDFVCRLHSVILRCLSIGAFKFPRVETLNP